MKESEERLHAIFENALDAVVGMDETGGVITWNSRAEQMFGWLKSEAIGRKMSSLIIPPNLRVDHENGLKRFRATHEGPVLNRSVEMPAMRKDGTIFPVELKVTPLKFGAAYVFSAFLSDITERKIAEQALKESEERFRRLIESTNVIAWEADAASGQFTYVSPQAEKLLGYPVSAWYETDFWSNHMHPEDRLWALHFCANSAKNQKEYEFEYRLLNAKNEIFWLRDIVSVEKTPNGQAVLRGFMIDINQRKHAEKEIKRYMEELKRSNLDLEQFAYIASHDLKEPLRVVAGYAQLLGKRYQDQIDANANEYIHYMLGGLGQMQNLIDGLLVFSRAGKKNSPFQRADCKISCDQAIANLAITIAENKAQITRDETFPIVMGDSTQLTQLFQNLIGNAIKFRGKDPLIIRISVVQNQEKWLFCVEDNGIGIKKEYFDRIFELFKRLHNYSEYPGTGIGLALCKKIVEYHGGRIWVESQVEKGSKFCFTLPIIKETEHAFQNL